MPNPPDEELVRRLLADARHDEPMPADVVARLDGVLDDLAAQRHDPRDAGAGAAVPLRRTGARRRGRRWAAGLVAAAAVATAITLGPRISLSSGGGEADDSRASRADSGASSSDSGGPPGRVAELHRDTLAADVRRTVRRLRTPGAELAAPSVAPESFACAAADWGPGTTTPVRLDGRAATLVLRPPAAGRQVAEVLECGTARVLASVTLPAR